MHKKALVIAVSAALVSTAAFAKNDGDSVVTLYGKAYPEIIFPSGSGATDANADVATLAGHPTGENAIVKRTEMSSSNSRLGVRGYERLGRDLKAIFQLETEFHVDSNDSQFARRNSFVGLSAKSWGTVKLGRMDTPFKSYGDDIGMFGISSGNFVSSSNVLRKTGFGTSSASSFHLRRQNAIQYESPVWGGFDFAVQYSTDEAKTSTRDPHVVSAAIEYERGPFKVSVAHEQHWDLFGGSKNAPSAMRNNGDESVNSKDKATQVMLEYSMGHHKFEADWIRKQYNENAYMVGHFSSYENNAYEVIWDARWSKAWRTQVKYIKAMKGSCSRVDAVCNTDGLDGSQINLGVAYYFSKKTLLYVIGAVLRNGYSARWNNSDLQDPAVGEDITQWAVGLAHSF